MDTLLTSLPWTVAAFLIAARALGHLDRSVVDDQADVYRSQYLWKNQLRLGRTE